MDKDCIHETLLFNELGCNANMRHCHFDVLLEMPSDFVSKKALASCKLTANGKIKALAIGSTTHHLSHRQGDANGNGADWFWRALVCREKGASSIKFRSSRPQQFSCQRLFHRNPQEKKKLKMAPRALTFRQSSVVQVYLSQPQQKDIKQSFPQISIVHFFNHQPFHDMMQTNSPDRTPDKPLADLHDAIEKCRAECGIPGMSVAVLHKGELIFAEGFGKRNEQGDPFEPTVAQLWS